MLKIKRYAARQEQTKILFFIVEIRILGVLVYKSSTDNAFLISPSHFDKV